MNVVRATSEEGFGRVAYNKQILEQLYTNVKFRDYFEQETTKLPHFYKNIIRNELGPLWDWLPDGAIYHDHNAYLKTSLEPKTSLERIAV